MLMNLIGVSSTLKAPDRSHTMKVWIRAVFLARSVMSKTVLRPRQSMQWMRKGW